MRLNDRQLEVTAEKGVVAAWESDAKEAISSMAKELLLARKVIEGMSKRLTEEDIRHMEEAAANAGYPDHAAMARELLAARKVVEAARAFVVCFDLAEATGLDAEMKRLVAAYDEATEEKE